MKQNLQYRLLLLKRLQRQNRLRNQNLKSEKSSALFTVIKKQIMTALKWFGKICLTVFEWLKKIASFIPLVIAVSLKGLIVIQSWIVFHQGRG